MLEIRFSQCHTSWVIDAPGKRYSVRSCHGLACYALAAQHPHTHLSYVWLLHPEICALPSSQARRDEQHFLIRNNLVYYSGASISAACDKQTIAEIREMVKLLHYELHSEDKEANPIKYSLLQEQLDQLTAYLRKNYQYLNRRLNLSDDYYQLRKQVMKCMSRAQNTVHAIDPLLAEDLHSCVSFHRQYLEYCPERCRYYHLKWIIP